MCSIAKDIGISKRKEICLPSKGSLRDHRAERTNKAYKCKIFEAVNSTLHGQYTHVEGIFVQGHLSIM